LKSIFVSDKGNKSMSEQPMTDALEQQHQHSHDEEQNNHHDHDHSHNNHDHDHSHDEHDHDHDHGEHDHKHAPGWLGIIQEAIPFLHGHSHAEANVDAALESNARGIWALKISLLGLGATALFQVIIALISGSTGLLADTIHNFSDAFTAVPLWIAFVLARRAANRRYTYGYGRAEDIAGVVIVLMIFASALLSGYESIVKILHPQPLQHVWWVLVAALIGFLGNEGVAIFRIRVGREIGSAALVADGQHARIDGLTSLAVLLGVFGSLLGYPLVDPLVGLLITVAILFIVKDTAVTIWRRLMDGVDPQIVDGVERVASQVSGVRQVRGTRVRWLGHALQADLQILIDENLSLQQSHMIIEEVRHALFHAQPRLTSIRVQPIPWNADGREAPSLTAHHDGTSDLASSPA
jgi:cation diffusion facilitator family transporter